MQSRKLCVWEIFVLLYAKQIATMKKNENYRNEIKSYIVRAGMTMSEVVDYLADEYGWSRSIPNLSGKLKRGSLRYGEAVELAVALGYDIVWQKRGKKGR